MMGFWKDRDERHSLCLFFCACHCHLLSVYRPLHRMTNKIIHARFTDDG